MIARLFTLLFLFALAVSGCQRNVYELSLEPEGGQLNRKLICYRVQGESEARVSFPEAELARVSIAYASEPTSPEPQKHAFEGTFTRTTPSDIGGAGYYLYFDSPMGTLTCYGERFRGTDNMADRVQKGLYSADWLVDRFVEWLEREFDGMPWWPAVHGLIDGELRSDVKNLVLFFWSQAWDNSSLNASDDGREKGVEIVARILLYLAERNYFQPEELPWLIRVVAAGRPAGASGEALEPWKEEQAFRFLLEEILSRKLGISEPGDVADSLLKFFMREDLSKSWEEYMKTTMEWQELWEREQLEDPDASPPPLEKLMEEQVGDLFALVLPFIETNTSGLGSDECARIHVRLASPGMPDGTNGIWNEEKKLVEWSGIFCEKQAPPAFIYAFWAEPDEAFQEEHFGRTVLEGMNLAKYVAWYAALSEKETQEWDEFIASLSPGDDLWEKIRSKEPLYGSHNLMDWPEEIFRDVLKQD